ncbi:MAG: hypothetical protein DDT23_00342 [candidate division WS2 bacterium]|nr:hypothetical protein [Candidatus Lithacetigena glycinireducens]
MGLPQGFALRNDFRGMTGVGKDEAAALRSQRQLFICLKTTDIV